MLDPGHSLKFSAVQSVDATACGFCTLLCGEVGQGARQPRTYLWCAPVPWAAAAVSGEWEEIEWRCAGRHGQGSWQVSLQ